MAINTQQEHDAIKAYITAAQPSCRFVWTSGRIDKPAGLNTWHWDLGTTKQPVTFFNFKGYEPDNDHNQAAAFIVIDTVQGFEWMDIAEDVSGDSYFSSKTMCFLCEIDLKQITSIVNTITCKVHEKKRHKGNQHAFFDLHSVFAIHLHPYI